MDDVVRVAIVDARENLFHEDSCVLFGEFPSGNDLIEEFSTLADSILEYKYYPKITPSQCSIFSHPRRIHTS
jgi:hypothetical protein